MHDPDLPEVKKPLAFTSSVHGIYCNAWLVYMQHSIDRYKDFVVVDEVVAGRRSKHSHVLCHNNSQRLLGIHDLFGWKSDAQPSDCFRMGAESQRAALASWMNEKGTIRIERVINRGTAAGCQPPAHWDHSLTVVGIQATLIIDPYDSMALWFLTAQWQLPWPLPDVQYRHLLAASAAYQGIIVYCELTTAVKAVRWSQMLVVPCLMSVLSMSSSKSSTT